MAFDMFKTGKTTASKFGSGMANKINGLNYPSTTQAATDNNWLTGQQTTTPATTTPTGPWWMGTTTPAADYTQQVRANPYLNMFTGTGGPGNVGVSGNQGNAGNMLTAPEGRTISQGNQPMQKVTYLTGEDIYSNMPDNLNEDQQKRWKINKDWLFNKAKEKNQFIDENPGATYRDWLGARGQFIDENPGRGERSSGDWELDPSFTAPQGSLQRQYKNKLTGKTKMVW